MSPELVFGIWGGIALLLIGVMGAFKAELDVWCQEHDHFPHELLLLAAMFWWLVLPVLAVVGVGKLAFMVGVWARSSKAIRLPAPFKKFWRAKDVEPLCPKCKSKGAYR